MKVSKQITGKAQDWEFTFDQAQFNDWIIEEEDSVLARIKRILPKLRAVSGVSYDDGTEITLEQIVAQEAPPLVYIAMAAAWGNAISNSFRTEAEEKKDESTNPSSDSSPTESTSQG